MAKRETKETYKDTREQSQNTQQQYKAEQDTSAVAIDKQQGGVDATGAALAEGYAGLGTAGTLAAHTIDAPRAIDVAELKTTLPRLREFGDTGGFTPERTSSIMENVSGLKEMGKTGGLTEENINRMKGMGGFDEFAKTGGYTNENIANIRARAISPIGSMATGTMDEMARRRSLGNSYAPGFDAANRTLQREASRGIADSALNAELGIMDRVNQGKMWGIGNVAGSEAGMAGMKTGNQLAGMQAGGNMELALQDTISKYRSMGLSMEQATAKALSDFDAMNVGNTQQANMFNAGQMTDADRFNITNTQDMQLAGLGGQAGLHSMNANMLENEKNRRQAMIDAQTRANLGYLGTQGQLATQPGIGGNIMNLAGTAAGIGSQFFMPGKPRVS